MSIKGFTVDGQDYQYNYPNLDNIPEITPESIGAASQEDFDALKEQVNQQNTDILNAFPVETVSGSIVAFTDGADELPIKAGTIHVEPVQDLHGYDSPWPAGGGKNLLNITRDDVVTSNGITFTPVFNSDGALAYINVDGTASARSQFKQTGVLSLKGGIEYVFSIGQNGDATGSKVTAFLSYPENGTAKYIDLASEASRIKAFTPVEDTTASFVLEVAAGYVGQQISNYKAFPMVRLSSVTDATFAPYSNICPISGWTGADVTRTGKNLCPPDGWVQGQLQSDGSIIVLSYAVSSPYILLTGGQTYMLSRNYPDYGDGQMAYHIYDLSKTHLSDSGWKQNNYAFTPESDCYIRITTRAKPQNQDPPALTPNDVGTMFVIQLELGSTATAYEPYKGNTYPITFPTEAGMVYGGTLDVTAGKLTVDRAYAVFDGSSDENWQMHGTIASWFYTDNAFTNVFTNSLSSNFSISNAYKQSPYSVAAAIKNGEFAIGYSSGSEVLRTVFKDTRYTTVQEWTNAVATNHIQLCYKLATPIVYDLTDEQISEITTYLGNNTMWADCGDVNITYRADPTEYINKKLAELQALVLENN